jgi:vitamin-K-epoxide reductase (warfarin-sensitive)
MIRKHAKNLSLFFLAGGLFASVYGLMNHYAPTGGGACNVSATFNCDIVNRGEFSEFLGLPVAGIGIVGYLVMTVVALMNRKEPEKTLSYGLVGLAAGGLAFSLYLTYIEAYVLATWCLICLASLSSIVGLLLTSVMQLQSAPPQPAAQPPAPKTAP